jgi:Kef-type K+ transport system membrane component KefB
MGFSSLAIADGLSFLPAWPLKLSEFLLLGLVLLAGLIGGRLAALSRVVPVITGYILVGFLCGPGGLNLLTETLLRDLRVFVDISIGLILFDLGRRIDLHWLLVEKWLLVTGIVESVVTFAALTALLVWFGVEPMHAAVVAAIGVATSAAVVMRVASDVGSEGPVTRRALSLVAINNLIAMLLFTILLSALEMGQRIDVSEAILQPVYLITASVVLGSVLFYVMSWLARALKRSGTDQFILQLAMVVGGVGLATMLKLSVLLTLLTLGLMVRNAHKSQGQQRLPVVEFGDLGQLCYVLLFVMTGASLKLADFSTVAWLALLFVFVRALAKALPIFAFAYPAKVSPRQSAALALTLTPLAGLSIGMTFMLGDVLPALASEAAALLLAAVTFMQFAGPIAARAGFVFAREADPNR